MKTRRTYLYAQLRPCGSPLLPQRIAPLQHVPHSRREDPGNAKSKLGFSLGLFLGPHSACCIRRDLTSLIRWDLLHACLGALLAAFAAHRGHKAGNLGSGRRFRGRFFGGLFSQVMHELVHVRGSIGFLAQSLRHTPASHGSKNQSRLIKFKVAHYQRCLGLALVEAATGAETVE